MIGFNKSVQSNIISKTEEPIEELYDILIKDRLNQICAWGKLQHLCPPVDWINLAQDRDQWRALVNTVMNLQAP
jgi:hypothetical protein